MPFYVRPLSVPKCWCGKRATVGVYNGHNALIEECCARHGRRKVNQMNNERTNADRHVAAPVREA